MERSKCFRCFLLIFILKYFIEKKVIVPRKKTHICVLGTITRCIVLTDAHTHRSETLLSNIYAAAVNYGHRNGAKMLRACEALPQLKCCTSTNSMHKNSLFRADVFNYSLFYRQPCGPCIFVLTQLTASFTPNHRRHPHLLV